MEINLQNIGWKSKIAQKRATLSISINKLVATGCCLEKGQMLYCYLAEDEHRRPIMVAYLDGKGKITPKKTDKFINNKVFYRSYDN